MYQDKTITAFIPARGGSKGIPKKNIKQFAGKPLIAFTIAAARESVYIDNVIVTTDSEEIASVARRYGAETPFLRPAELARDESKTIDAIVHARDCMEDLDRPCDIVVLLQPTSPLRRASEIDAAIEYFFDHGCMGLASVCAAREKPVLLRRLDASGVLHPLLPVLSTARRQDMPDFWKVDGAIYINKNSDINLNTSFNDNPIGFVMPELRSSDIDSFDDFELAERLVCELGDALPTEAIL